MIKYKRIQLKTVFYLLLLHSQILGQGRHVCRLLIFYLPITMLLDQVSRQVCIGQERTYLYYHRLASPSVSYPPCTQRTACSYIKICVQFFGPCEYLFTPTILQQIVEKGIKPTFEYKNGGFLRVKFLLIQQIKFIEKKENSNNFPRSKFLQ